MGYSNVDEARLAELRSLLDKNKITSKKKKGFQSFISDYAPIKEENRIESNMIESEQRPNSDLHRMNREKYGESAEYYAQLKNSADFNEKAKQGLAIKKPEYNDTSKKGFFDTLFSDYDPITYSNGNSGMLTEEEQNIYGYLVSTQGEKKAKQYLDTLYSQMNERRGEKLESQAEKMADEHPILSSALTVPTNIVSAPFAAIQASTDAIKYIIDGTNTKSDPYKGAYMLNNYSNKIRETISNNIRKDSDSEAEGNVKAFLYETGMSMADFLGTLAVTGGNSAANMALMGTKSGSDTAIRTMKKGGTPVEALMNGAFAGAAEAAFEKIPLDNLFSIIGKSGKEAANKTIVRAMLSQGMSEFGEEACTEIANTITDYLVMGDLSDYNLSVKAYTEQGLSESEAKHRATMDVVSNVLVSGMGGFVSGAAIGGASSSINSAINHAYNRASEKTSGKGFTDSEQAVFDKVYEKAVAEREADGIKLTDKEKSKLYDSIAQQMEKGGIDIDTIESTLGGDAYKSYKDTVDSEEKLKKVLNELSNTETGKLTRNQLKRLEQLESMNLDDTTKRDSLRKQLDDTLSPLLENSRLAESYNQAERRKQAFQADLTQYKGKQRAAVERAINSGVLNDTYRSHELVDILSKIEADKGISFDYTNNAKLKESGFAIDGKTVNGYVTKNGVTLNVQSSKAWQSVVGHEITHVLEGTDAYTELRNALYKYAESKGELESRKSNLTELYKNVDADIDAELTAELVGDYLFSDKDFINHLTENRTIFRKIYDEIKYLCKVATGKELTDTEKVKREFDKAWKEVSGKGVDGKTQYDISYTTENDPVVVVDEDILQDVPQSDWVKTVKNTISEKFSDGIPVSGRLIKVNSITRSEYTNSKYSKYLRSSDGAIYQDKFKSANNLDDIVLASTNYINEDLKHERNDKFKEFARGDVLIRVGDNDYSAKIIVGFTTGNQMVLYDVVDFTPTTFTLKKEDNSIDFGENRNLRNELSSVGTILPQELNGVNTSISENAENDTKSSQFSLSDNNSVPLEQRVSGDDLLDAQDLIDTVKDVGAKVDENGYITVYHRTNSQSKEKILSSGSMTAKEDGVFFSTKKDGQNSGYGSEIIEFKIPAEKLMLDDIFDDEAHLRLPLKRAGEIIDVNQYLNKDTGNSQFSLSENGEQPSTVGTPLQDLYYDQDIAPVAENVTTDSNFDAPLPNDVPPMTDEETNPSPDENTEADAPNSLEAIQTELANLKDLRSETFANYNQKIEQKQKEFDSKKNKDSKVANNLKMQIERLKRIRDSMDADYSKRINNLETRERLVREGKPTKRQEHYDNIISNVKSEFSNNGFDFDEVLKNAKNLSTFSTVDNTPQRVMEKALGYKEGQLLSDLTVNKVAQNETEGIKWLNSFTDRKNGLLAELSKQYKIKPGSKESAAAQMYAEGFYVNDNNEIIKYGDDELAQDFPDVEVRNNIKGLAKDARIRQIYDETLNAINESRKRNAYPEIPRLNNYFLHFRSMEDTFSKLGLPFNPNDIRAKDLPTDLNGVTADLKPGQPYFASANKRTGKRTSFDLLGGLERYLTSAKDQIYHIDDIQTLRALRNYIADTYGQAKGLENLDSLTEEEAQEKIKEVYGSHLSTFAKFLNEEANVIAGKTALIDRGLEGVIGRRGMTFLNTVNKQVGSNMVGFNISSSLTNFLPVAQTFAKTNKFDFLKAFAQTVSNKFGSIFGKGDSFAENSPVMIRRKGADRFYRTPFQKAGDVGYVLMSAVDDISTEMIARTKYNEFTRKGMDEQQAHFETDKWVSRLMGDRSLGQQPQLYNSKTLGIFTKFQLEVRNQLDSQFYDTIQEAKVSNEDIKNGLERNAKIAAKVTSTFVQLAVAQHLFGKAFESVAGYNPAFDIISVLATLFGFDDDDESEDTVLDNIEQGFLELLEDLPYTSTFTGGRIPISSALPVSELIQGKDSYGNDKSRLKILGEAAPYYVLPGGYGQIKKTAQGLGMFSDEHPVSGSYTDSGNLRFPVEDTPLNRVQAGIFGQYANENSREYFDNDYAPLKEKQIQEYVDADIPISDYWKYREGLKGLKTNAEKADYINSLDIEDWQKNMLLNNILDRKEKVDMSNYDDYGSFEEFDYAEKNPEKYEFFKENGISYENYANSDEDGKAAYTWAYNNPEKFKVAKVVAGDVVKYRSYTSDLYDIKADNDENGDTITGTGKAKKIDYINSLDLDYGQKIILFKSQYKTDDTYNAEIVEYLNSRDDVSYDEMVDILTELGFTVTDDGVVKWD